MRHIKASEVRKGMEIEWTSLGWHHRGVVSTVVRNDHVGVWVQSSDGFEMSVEPDQAFTVLSEPQPEEPTAFGACVEVAGVKYVRVDEHEPALWSDADGDWSYWAEILDAGHVTVINADPFAGAREPRVWDRWEDVPEMTPVCASGLALPYRKVGDRIECKLGGPWAPAFAGEHDLNNFSPFTEVL